MVKLDDNYFSSETKSGLDINSFLLPSENILLKKYPKKSAYVAGKCLKLAPIAILWAVIDISILFLIFSSGIPTFALFFIIPFFALHLTPLWAWIASLIKANREHKTILYLITDKRILELRGDVKYVYASVFFDEIKDAKLNIGFVDKLLGVGDITIITNDKQLVLSDISDSINLHTKIMALIKNPKSTSDEIEKVDEKVECIFCGSVYSASENKCPSCAAPNKGNKKLN